MFLSSLVSRIVSGRRRRLVTLELGTLSERRLGDLGISRIDILAAALRR
jgi:uncharacterized protein YjiS (DUF1127 family)